MDPEQTLIEYFEAVTALDFETAADCLDDLLTWIEHGGFAPGLNSPKLKEFLASRLAIVASESSAQVVWNADDLTDVYDMSAEQAAEFLEKHAEDIVESMTEKGWHVIGYHIDVDGYGKLP